MNTYTAVFAIPEIVIILIGVACIVWVVRTAREHKQAAAKNFLDQAWREVLNDPHYLERRHFEERKRVEDYDHKHAATAIR
jgi:cbb3-type cytochrome oxidase subunit 3